MQNKEKARITQGRGDDGHAILVEKNPHRAGIINGCMRLEDGQEALDFFPADAAPQAWTLQNFVVLMAVNMPRVDASGVLRRLTASASTAATPVTMLTATGVPSEIERGSKFGYDVYVIKPVKYDALIKAIRRREFFLQAVNLQANIRGGLPS